MLLPRILLSNYDNHSKNDAKTAPAFSKLLRHEAKFSADWAISGMSATFFNWTVFHKSDVIELMKDSEDTYANEM